MSAQLRIRERIASTGQSMTWRQGFEAMTPRGGMSPHLLLDRHLCDEGYRATLQNAHRQETDREFPFLARELVAHPAIGEKFRSGSDINDPGTGLYLPWSEVVSHVPPSELIRRKTQIFVNPGAIIDTTLRSKHISVIQAQSIIIVHPVVEVSGTWGEVDEHTGMVLEVSDRRLKKLPEMKRRRLYREDGQSLGLLVRYDLYFDDRRQFVVADYRASDRFGVAGVVYDVLDEHGQVIATTAVKPDTGQPIQHQAMQQQG